MLVEVITPESQVFVGEANAVQLPGLDGLFQVLNNHAPIISALKGGTVKVDLPAAFSRDENTHAAIREEKGGKSILIDVKGGVAEMMNNKLIVLAE
jgi:F-type H+-transporting ATPase subunit epsilon